MAISSKRFGIGSEKAAELADRLDALGIFEEDLVERFVRASGPGGQKVNKTSSAVYLKHLPSGIEVKAQGARSQALNRFTARWRLAERLEDKVAGERSAIQQRAEKIRRQKRKRSKRAKEKVLAAKRQQSQRKKGRQRVDPNGD